jgi:GIY-YIG catalytic domain
MPLFFNSLLAQLGVSPANIILLRHQDNRAAPGRTPYELWRDNRPAFESYQSFQRVENRSKFSRAPNWASFVGTADGGTMFVGLYAAKFKGVLAKDTPQPHRDGVDLAGSCDVYDLQLDEGSVDLGGKLFIDWGSGTRAWVQRAENQNKQIVELRPEFKEPDFPGFLNFIKPLSEVAKLPKTWVAILRETRGVYLLTCPNTKEQYIGSASGDEGLWRRWMDYVTNNHGGNVALKSRESSDYRVSILEVAGSASNADEILRMESKWKAKLQSREMGLNRN